MTFGPQEASSLLREFGVYFADREVASQRPEYIVAALAERRGFIYQRDPSVIDGIFGSWLVCLPGFPQDESYSRLMRNVRRELFTNATPKEVHDRAGRFFADDGLALELHELISIVSRPGALDEPIDGGREVRLFDPSVLSETPIPNLGGLVHVGRRRVEVRGSWDL
jgi:hypothetical protein